MGCDDCGAVKGATARIHKDRRAHERNKLLIVCGAVLLCVAIVCATVLGCYTISKQQETIVELQYALNMQYAGLLECIAGAEVTTTTTTNEADAGDGGTAVAGENNTVVWGDMNDGNSEDNEDNEDS